MKKASRSVMIKAAVFLLAGTMVISFTRSQAVSVDEEGFSYATATNTLDVDPVYVGETITIEEEPVVEFEGTVTDESPTCEFTYTAPRDGCYWLEITDVKNSCNIRFNLYDSLNNDIWPFFTITSHMVQLEEGETYSLIVTQESGNTPFVVHVKAQKPTTDLTDATLINDQIMFEDQKNVYTYTAPETGIYYFSLLNTTSNVDFELMIWDPFDMNIIDSTTGSFIVDLDAGETYEIQVLHFIGTGAYTLKIDPQKPVLNISGYTVVNDSIEHANQINSYTFIPPVTGDYFIGISSVEGAERYNCAILDSEDTEIGGNSNLADIDWNSGGTYTLAEGKEYKISMEYTSGYGNYTLTIKYPTAASEYLENFATDSTESASTTTADGSETEETSDNTATEEPSQTDLLQQKNDELQSELEKMQEENNRLKEILDENEIIYD
ncbi:MAG: hypothetical protein LUI13_13790 [Lachnospiraceae bacterium]|nr:hypothetical protein [Lachnospiraceae bacterium]